MSTEVQVWICPGCGSRYSGPTSCTNDHEPIAAVAYPVPAGTTGTTTLPFAGTERRHATGPRRTGAADLRVSAGTSPTGTERRITTSPRRAGSADRRVAVAFPATTAPQGVVPPVSPDVLGTTIPTAATLAGADAAAKANLVAAVHGLEQALVNFKTLIGG